MSSVSTTDIEKPVSCPLNGSRDIHRKLRVRDHSSSGDMFEIWEDRSSGILFTSPAPDEAGIWRYYDMQSYLSHDSEQGGLMAAVYSMSRELMLRKKIRMLRPLSSSGSKPVHLLDIGCGTGSFMKFCADQNPKWKIHGIEPAEKAAQTAAGQSESISVFPDEKSIPDDHTYDLVTAWHALEHIHRLDELMTQISNRLTSNGLFCVALPNHSSFDARHYGEHWAGYDVPRHLWHFSPEAFTAYAASFGFRLFRKHRLPLDPFYIALLSEKAAGKGITGVLKAGCVASWSSIVSLADINQSSSIAYILTK